MKRKNYAIAEIAGQQIILEPGKKVEVPKLNLEEGEKYTSDKILYLRDGDKVDIGQPFVKNCAIETTVAEHDRADKVIVFKKKRRKGYKVKNGHRQQFTVLEVGEFSKKAAPKKVAKKTEKKTAPKKVAEKTTQKPVETKSEDKKETQEN